MARDFTKNLSNYMSLGVGTLGTAMNGAAFISAHCWVKADTFDTGATDNIICAGTTGAASGAFITLRVDGSVSPKVLRGGGRSGSGDGLQARNATTEFTTGAWHSCGVALDFAGDVVTPYFNGVAENSGAVTFANSTYTDDATGRTNGDAIGAGFTVPGVTTQQTDGLIAEVSFWFGSRALTAAEFVSLSKGCSAKLIAPALGRIHFPLMGNASPERDIFRGLSGTITGTVAKADHPRILQPSATIYPFVAPADGGAVGPLVGGHLIHKGILNGRLVA